jgi:predicted phosphate transport protein (TIGR00153 family)
VARFSLIPKDGRFFDDFILLAQELRKASRVLADMLKPEQPRWDAADELKALEHQCDQIAHESLNRLNQTFVTPLDREDIHTLILYLDNVMDMIDAAGGCVRLYKIRSCRYGARELADIIVRCTDQILYATQKLESRQGLEEHVVEINRLENEADQIHGEAVGRLFTEEPNAIEVLKWKEILDLLERATDECEDVANEVEGVLVKYA